MMKHVITLEKFLSESVQPYDPDVVPSEPGTEPIPQGHLRLYHYTKSPDNAQSIAKEGITMAKSVSQNYGDPTCVWASSHYPTSAHTVVEFVIPKNDPRDDYPTDSDVRDVVKLFGDVLPEEIIAIHLEWHQHYRGMTKRSTPQQVLDGKYDHLLNMDDAWKKAIEVLKKDAQKGKFQTTP